jgi:membrane protein required for colicin V production
LAIFKDNYQYQIAGRNKKRGKKLNIIDYIVLSTLLWFAYKGFRNGIILELATSAGIVIGIILAKTYYLTLSKNIDFLLNNDSLGMVVSFICLFISTIILANIAGILLKKIINLIFLGIFDKLLGSIFGVVKAVIIIKISFILLLALPGNNTIYDSVYNSWTNINVGSSKIQYLKKITDYLPKEFINKLN